MSIGTNIKQFREERNLTQEMTAEKLGITYQAVSSWERDEYKPETDNLINGILLSIAGGCGHFLGPFSCKSPLIMLL